MRIVIDGEIESICVECGRDARGAVEFSNRECTLCTGCMLRLEAKLEEALSSELCDLTQTQYNT